ncbi:MAG: hypothetical protein IKP79_01705 [Bacilli bacterium]|nr:hypothetical protein [Bacilli bacterium]
MKLNNKGWGVFQMAWMTGIILFFFLLAIILIHNLYRYLELKPKDKNIITEKTRDQMMSDLDEAAIRYMEYNYENLKNVNSMKITSERLFQAGLFAKDLYGGCTGYVIASKTNDEIFTRPYIRCGDYKSVGYDQN